MATRDEGARRWYHRGLALCNTRNYSEAVVCYDRALERSPDDLTLLKRKGFALIKAGRYDDAATCFDRVLAIDPGDATAWQRKGYALVRLGRHEDAVACCDRALRLDPEHISAWQCRGWVLGIMCRYDEAVDCYEAVLSIDPERESAVWHRDRMRERRDLAALDAEIREAGQLIDVPDCIADVAEGRDYGNVGIARAVLQEMVGRAEGLIVQRR